MNAFLSEQPDVGDKIELVPREDVGTTGNFIVTVQETGQILHSNRMGLGKATSTGERLAILDQIKDLLEDE